MKVLCLTSTINPESGGWGRYSRSVLDEFERQQVEYKVLTLGSPLRPADSIGNIIRNCLVVRAHAHDCDIVHAFDTWPFAIYGYVAVFGTDKKLFVSAVGTYSIPPKKLSLKRLLMVLALRRARGVFAISEYTKQRLIDSVPLENVSVVYMGASVLPQVAGAADARSKFGIPEESHPILMTVGQIKHRKGQLDTLKAIALVKRRHSHVMYLMVGSDEDREYVGRIRREITSLGLDQNTRIISNADNADLASLYAITDIFVMVSNTQGQHFEGFGLVFLEAAGFGKPAVGGRGSGIGEAMEDGYNGYLAEQGNPEDIAEKIEDVLAGDMSIWAKHAREFHSRFTWKATVEKYIEHYRR